MFYHSLISDWNHGNAHFLRGVATELLSRGHEVRIFEPRDSWSVKNLLLEEGPEPIQGFQRAYPKLCSRQYEGETLDLDEALEGADLAIVHEWNEPVLVRQIGEHHSRRGGYSLLFHDTHHRMVTDPDSMGRYDLEHYDGVLAYGEVLRRLYERSGRVARTWTWHEAADTRVFHPLVAEKEGDLVWIGNWGDGERSAEIEEFLVRPCQALSLKARVHGVRYPESAQTRLRAARIEYAGWLPNYEVPRMLAGFKVTVHIPRRPYVEALPGIPTIRPFEALACGVPLVCSPWHDAEGLFSPGRDYLVAHNEREMTRHLRSVLEDEGMALGLASHGLQTIRARHTCAHRVDELLAIDCTIRGRELAPPTVGSSAPATDL